MFVNITELKRLLPYSVKARLSIMLRAKHGVGKSELTEQLRDKIGAILYPDAKERHAAYKMWMKPGEKEYIYPRVERRLSQMADAGELMGLPFMDGHTTAFHPMAWFWKACEQPCILHLDEMDRGPQDVRMATMQIGDSREVAGHKLHKDTIVVACVNGGIGETAYQVGDLDPAELSRWDIYDLRPALEEWVDHAKDQSIDPMIIDFIKNNKSFLSHDGEFESGKVYPCPRSWFRFNKKVSGSDLLENCDTPEKMLTLHHLCGSSVGNDIATAFTDFVKSYDKKITVDDIIMKGNFKGVKKLDVGQHMALVDKFEEHDIFKTKMFDGDVQDNEKEVVPHKEMINLAKYLLLIDPEVVMKAWEIVTRLEPDNGVALHGQMVNGKSISDLMARLNGAVTTS